MKHASTSQADQRTNADPHYLPKELQHMLRGESDNAIGESKISRQHTHSMVPQQYAQGDYDTPMQEETSTLDDAAAQTHAVMIMVHGASGGIGTSTFAALLAWMLKLEQLKCALVDLNLQAGGFDILLGQESAPGLRWSQIRAPLGTIDAQSLCQELPRWQGMPLLSSDPWKSTPAQWWEIIAALKALISCKHAVIADIGTMVPPHALHALSNKHTDTASSSGGKHTAYSRHDEIAQHSPVPTGAVIGARATIHVIVVEMSVLGVARAQGLIQAWKTVDISWRQCFAVGMLPDVSRSVVVDITSAQQYLGIPVVAQFRSMRSVRTSIVSGLGLPRIPRQYRKSLSRVVRACQEYAPSGAL